MAVAFSFLVCLIAVAGPSTALCSDSAPLNKRMEAILKRDLPEDHLITLQVADLETGQILMEKNPHLPLVPASTMKVVTTSAALSALKPDFTFATEIFADGVRGSSVGNIYLRGLGDPYLVSEQLFALTRAVRDKGLGEVRGGIVTDDAYFNPGPPLDEQEKLGYRSYHAPYGALSLNFNSVRIIVDPASKPGDPAYVRIDPQSDYAMVQADVKTVKGHSPAKLVVNKEATDSVPEVIYVNGTIGSEAAMKSHYVNVTAPALYTGEVFKEFLLREGVKVSGRVTHGKVPANAVQIHKFDSWPLGVIVYWLNKHSNNFMAEQISLALGAAVHGVPGTREKGLAVIRDHLLRLKVQENTFALSEASGLSRNNRLAASVLVRVLLAAAHDFSYNTEFMSSLGVGGVDGTLKEKFTDPDAKRRIRAKTGNLRGINALAGYGISRKGRTFAFAVIVNSNKPGAGFIDYGEKIVRSILDIS